MDDQEHRDIVIYFVGGQRNVADDIVFLEFVQENPGLARLLALLHHHWGRFPPSHRQRADHSDHRFLRIRDARNRPGYIVLEQVPSVGTKIRDGRFRIQATDCYSKINFVCQIDGLTLRHHRDLPNLPRLNPVLDPT